MLRRWFEEGVIDSRKFRQRARWLWAALVLAEVGLFVTVLATRYSP